MSEKREYLKGDVNKGFPAGESIRYRCLICGEVLPSMPPYAVACKCRNVIVDVDAGRVTVKDALRFEAYIYFPE